MAQIDWNEFIIVETIDLFENEELPAPLAFDKSLDKKPKSKIKIVSSYSQLLKCPSNLMKAKNLS